MREILNTDGGNALRLIATHGAEIRHVGTWDTWLVWDGTRWRRDTRREVVERAKHIARGLYEEALKETGDERKAAIRWALESDSARRIDAMIRLARSDPRIAIDPEDLDAHPWLLNVANGTVDLRTGTLRPHIPDELHTKLADVDYSPDAVAPTWDRFLDQVQPDEEVREFIARGVGYSATGLVSEQVLMFPFGGGANGKTTFTRAVSKVLGDYARQADPELLLARRDSAHPTGLADLHGARLVVTSEVDDGRRFAEGLLKQLTGGDKIKARLMHKDFFEFEPTHTLWVSGNHRPVIRGTDHAIWRRLRIIPFTVTIPLADQDKRLAEKLADEAPGILRWITDGCRRWQAGGLTEPRAVMLATDSYRAEMDTLGQFLTECCAAIPDATASAAELYAAYCRWCEANGEHTDSQRRFGASLTERQFERYRSGHHRWRGLTLLDPSTDHTLDSVKPSTRTRGGINPDSGSNGSKGTREVSDLFDNPDLEERHADLF